METPTSDSLLARAKEEAAYWTAMVAALTPPVVVTPPAKVEPIPTPTPAPPKTEPAKPKLAGEPRKQVGKDGNDRVADSTLGLLLIFSDSPDRFMPIGYNRGYTALPGITKPTGQATTNYGNDAPVNFTRPTGYRKRYFVGGRLYWEQSDLADEMPPKAEVPPTKVDSKPAPKPGEAVTPVANDIDLSQYDTIAQYESNQNNETV